MLLFVRSPGKQDCRVDKVGTDAIEKFHSTAQRWLHDVGSQSRGLSCCSVAAIVEPANEASTNL